MARKNGNGEGSRPRERVDGRWEARYWKDGKLLLRPLDLNFKVHTLGLRTPLHGVAVPGPYTCQGARQRLT